MDIDQDHLRRELRDTQAAHVSALGNMRDFVARLIDPSSRASDQQKHDLLLRGVNRRRFLQIGGVGVLSAAVLAACGNDDDKDASTATTGDKEGGSATDLAILRTASSLEHVAIDVYQKAIDSGLVKTAAIGDAAKLFQMQHKDHAGFFEGATKELGGDPFTKANPAVMASLADRIAALKTELDIVTLARDLENVAAATYQSTVGAFDNIALNEKTMSVGGVEARHAAVLNGVLKSDVFATKAFHTTTGAVAVGTGI
jgi:hypothetical protein